MNENGYGGIFDGGGLPAGFGEPAPTVKLKEERPGASRNPLPPPPRANPKVDEKFPAKEEEAVVHWGSTEQSYAGAEERKAERKAFFQNLMQGITGSMGTGSTSSSGVETVGYCVRTGKDSWTYHQYPDGSVIIADGPSHADPTKKHAAGSAWASGVERMYGKCTATASTLTTSGLSSSAATGGKGAEIGAGIGAAAAPLLAMLLSSFGPTQVTPLDPGYEDLTQTQAPSGNVPWGIILGGAGVLAVLVGGVYLVTRGRNDEPHMQVEE